MIQSICYRSEVILIFCEEFMFDYWVTSGYNNKETKNLGRRSSQDTCRIMYKYIISLIDAHKHVLLCKTLYHAQLSENRFSLFHLYQIDPSLCGLSFGSIFNRDFRWYSKLYVCIEQIWDVFVLQNSPCNIYIYIYIYSL